MVGAGAMVEGEVGAVVVVGAVWRATASVDEDEQAVTTSASAAARVR
jgi:hypothetical protein